MPGSQRGPKTVNAVRSLCVKTPVVSQKLTCCISMAGDGLFILSSPDQTLGLPALLVSLKSGNMHRNCVIKTTMCYSNIKERYG